MKRIAAIVINSVSHDARVLKEADSLATAGYEVAIFGIQDNRCSEPLTVRPSGVRIHLCNWKFRAHVQVARLILLTGLIVTVAAILIWALMLDQIVSYLTSKLFIEHLSLLGVVLIAIPFVKAYRRTMAIANRAKEAVAAPGPRASRPSWSPMSVRGAIGKIKGLVSRAAMKRELLASIARFAPDAVHCHDLNSVPIGYAYKRKSGCPLVFDSHELYEELSMSTAFKKRLSQFRQRYYSSRIDAFITINDSIADYLTRKYPRLPKAVIVKNATLNNGHRVEYDGRLHKAAELLPEHRILLYQGGFSAFRGLDALVKAGGMLPEPWRLVMMGWGNFEPQLRAIAAGVDPTGRKIRFIPPAPQRELAEWTAGGALGVIPYENVCLNHWFCTPNKLWEYPVAGVPILASPFPELAKAVTNNAIGCLLADPVTPRNIADSVAAITHAELVRMKQNCSAYIERDNWAVYEKRLVAVYDQVLGRVREESVRAPASFAEPKIVPAGAHATIS